MYRIFTDTYEYKIIKSPKHLWLVKLLDDHKLFNDDTSNWFVESNAIYPISKVVLAIIDNSKVWE